MPTLEDTFHPFHRTFETFIGIDKSEGVILATWAPSQGYRSVYFGGTAAAPIHRRLRNIEASFDKGTAQDDAFDRMVRGFADRLQPMEYAIAA